MTEVRHIVMSSVRDLLVQSKRRETSEGPRFDAHSVLNADFFMQRRNTLLLSILDFGNKHLLWFGDHFNLYNLCVMVFT
jgi:hypothetical protein